MSQEVFENPTNVLSGNTIFCRHYQQEHRWDKKDAIPFDALDPQMPPQRLNKP